MNAPIVSQHFELNAPSFERRLAAAKKVQDANYSVRIRIDPILKFNGWEQAYSEMINRLLTTIQPKRITLGTLRFEKNYFKNRESMFQNKRELLPIVDTMEPMLPVNQVNGKYSIGKYSFPEQDRIEIFRFIISEVCKYSNAPIALCKEIKSVWDAVGLDSSNIQCVCQV